ncbi:hypothetical protein ACGFI3_06200 [Nonomuraea wenchangensis]|uniref:hypothetical protein n=1 Tax=Nonomuraea wenchangensis TaxID=568860 RepID=UPI003718FD91
MTSLPRAALVVLAVVLPPLGLLWPAQRRLLQKTLRVTHVRREGVKVDYRNSFDWW